MNKIETLIEKYQTMLDVVDTVIKVSDDNEDILTAQAVKRFLKDFINDLKSLL